MSRLELYPNTDFLNRIQMLKDQGFGPSPDFSLSNYRDIYDRLMGLDEKITIESLQLLNPNYHYFIPVWGIDRKILFSRNTDLSRCTVSSKLVFELTAAATSGKDAVSDLLKEGPLAHLIIRTITGTDRKHRPDDPYDTAIHNYSPEEFQRLINNGEFAEHVKQGPYRYGTKTKELVDALNDPEHPIVSWRGEPMGAKQLKLFFRNYPNVHVLMAYMLPDKTYKELFDEIRMKRTDKEAEAWRIGKAIWEFAVAADMTDVILYNPKDPSKKPIRAVRAIENLLKKYIPTTT